MKKKWMLAALATMLSVSAASPVLAGHIYAGEGAEKTVSYDADGGRVITLTFDPAQMPEELKQKFSMTTEILVVSRKRARFSIAKRLMRNFCKG